MSASATLNVITHKEVAQMIYEVRARLFFTLKDEADDFIHDIDVAMSKAVVVHPDEPNQQGCICELIKCFHDETPVKPCISCGVIQCP